MRKEQNFISAVVFLNNNSIQNIDFLSKIYSCLDERFLYFEIIAISNRSKKNNVNDIREWAKSISKPLTLINMSLLQSHEQCMNAGLDCSIGDYIYEFESDEISLDSDVVWKAYELTQRGNDIVTVCPTTERWTSRLFYNIFNANSHAEYRLRTNIFRISSRRALNRVHSISANLPYRKAAYATCGLKMAELEIPGSIRNNVHERFSLASDSLVLYTDFGYKFSIGLTALMFAVTFAELIYTIVIWINDKPIVGWTTTMFVITFGMTGLFAILAIMLKYLTLLLKITFKKQDYLVESIEKM